MQQEEIDLLISKLEDPSEENAFQYSDKLAFIGNDYVLEKMISLLYADNPESKYLAARTLGKMKDNGKALDPLLEAIHDYRNRNHNGGMVEALDNFDLADKFVDVLRIYLFGNFKSSALSKVLLDSVEFDVTLRTIRKAEKHFLHFLNNSKNDEAFAERKQEVETILQELKSLFDE